MLNANKNSVCVWERESEKNADRWDCMVERWRMDSEDRVEGDGGGSEVKQ